MLLLLLASLVMKPQILMIAAQSGGTILILHLNLDGLVDAILMTLCLHCILHPPSSIASSILSPLASLTSDLSMSLTLTIHRAPQDLLRSPRPMTPPL